MEKFIEKGRNSGQHGQFMEQSIHELARLWWVHAATVF
jgi:hypothetical protein